MVRYFLDYSGRTVECEITSFSAMDAIKQAAKMAYDNPDLHYFALRRRNNHGENNDVHPIEIEIRPSTRLADAKATDEADDYEHLACNLWTQAVAIATIEHSQKHGF